MKRKYLFLIVLVLLALSFSCAALSEGLTEWPLELSFYDLATDFTVETISGDSFTFSEALADKDMVLINLWATWCGPCEMEFPYMQEAYELYQDRIGIIALSIEPNDSADVLAAYAAAHGMTFPVANGYALGLGDIFVTSGIPTTLIVDRFGKIVFYHVGAVNSTSFFTRVFDFFTGESYTESKVLTEIPAAKPNFPGATESELSTALSQNTRIAFSNDPDPFVWPMIPVSKDDRTAVKTTNSGEDSTVSSLIVHTDAGSGQMLAFDYASETEALMDLLLISVDGNRVKAFGGMHDWSSYAIPLYEGEHEIVFEYRKDTFGSVAEDAVWLDNFRLVSAEEGALILEAQPRYPVSDEITLTVLNEDARRIIFDDPSGILSTEYYSLSYWIVPSQEVRIAATVNGSVDMESAFLYNNYDGQIAPLFNTASDNGFLLTITGHDSLDTTGYADTGVFLYPSADVKTTSDIYYITLFACEEDVNALIEYLTGQSAGKVLGWSYAAE